MSAFALNKQKRINKVALVLTFGLLNAFAPFATDMYLSSFPSIADSLHSSIAEVQFSVATFFIGIAVGQLFYGPLIDRFGRRLPLLIGITFFTIGAFAAIFSPNIGVFNSLRIVQAVGGCSGMIICRAIIQDLFNTNEAARALSMMMMVQGIGPVAAPVMGGYIYSFFGWKAVFVFLTLFGICCLLATLKYIPETLDTPRPINPKQILGNFTQVLSNRSFLTPLLSGSMALATIFIFISASPFVFMVLHKVSKEHYTWIFGICAGGMLIAAQINTMLLKRFSPLSILRVTLIFLIIMSALLVAVTTTGKLIPFIIVLFFCIATVPITGANSTAIAMSACGKNAGTASSLVGVTQYIIAGFISALVGWIHNGTAYPMTMTMCMAAVLAFIILMFNGRRPR